MVRFSFRDDICTRLYILRYSIIINRCKSYVNDSRLHQGNGPIWDIMKNMELLYSGDIEERDGCHGA